MHQTRLETSASSSVEPFPLPRVVSPERFRAVLGSVATPVSVVTALLGGRPHGATVSAFCSLSLHPPLVLVSLDQASALLRIVRANERFGINVLASDQVAVARRFARKGIDKFDGVDWYEDEEVPRIPGSAGWLACRRERIVPGGDHAIILGLVLTAESRAVEPLVYRDRAFGTVVTRPQGTD